MYSPKDTYKNIYSSSSHTSPNLETTKHPTTVDGMNEQKAVLSYCRILHSSNKPKG